MKRKGRKCAKMEPQGKEEKPVAMRNMDDYVIGYIILDYVILIIITIAQLHNQNYTIINSQLQKHKIP